jgi:hypothetical protein
MLDKEHPYEKISDALGITYEEDKKLPVVTKTAPLKTIEDPKIDDLDYMKMEIKSLIENGVNTLEKLSEDIKIGTSVRSHEVYFNGLGSVRELIKELKELNIDNMKAGKESAKEGVVNNTQINNFFSGKDLAEMMKKAKKNSQMNDIVAEFKIDDTEFKNF